MPTLQRLRRVCVSLCDRAHRPGALHGAALALLLVAPSARTEPSTDVDLSEVVPAQLPYRLEPAMDHELGVDPAETFRFFLHDLDGDGQDEIVHWDPGRFVCSDFESETLATRWQYNLPPGYALHRERFDLGAAVDVDGDGLPEVLLAAGLEDGSDWRLFVLKPQATGVDTLRTWPLPVGPDRSQDGVWDGNYRIIGVSNDLLSADRPALILGCRVLYDAVGRCALAIDPATGEILWRFQCGPNVHPTGSTLADLDGDGEQEIVLGTGSPDNYEEDRRFDPSDDVVVLFALNLHGRLLWQRTLAGKFHGLFVRAHDLDGIKGDELVVGTQNSQPGESDYLLVYSGEGRRLAAKPLPSGGCERLVVLETENPARTTIVVGLRDNGVHRYQYLADERAIRMAGRARAAEPLLLLDAVSLFPEQKSAQVAVYLAGRNPARVFMLSERLQPLAAYTAPAGDCRSAAGPPAVMHLSDQKERLIWPRNGGGLFLDWTRVRWWDRAWGVLSGPLPSPQWQILLLLCISSALWGGRKWGWARGFRRGESQGRLRGRSEGREIALTDVLTGNSEPAPPPGRDQLLRIFQALDHVKHANEQKTATVLRGDLLDELQYFAEEYEDSGGNLQTYIRPFLRHDLGTLQDVLSLIPHWPDWRNELRLYLDSLTPVLGALERGELQGPELRSQLPTLKRHILGLASVIDEIYTAVRIELSTHLAEIEEIVDSRRESARQAGVRIELVRERVEADLLCLIKREDLWYVVGNLLDNAQKAIGNGPEGRIRVELDGRELERGGPQLVVRVCDNGRGLSEQTWRDVREGRLPGGTSSGTGLRTSLALLEPWGAALRLLVPDSPQWSTSLELRLRVVRTPDA